MVKKGRKRVRGENEIFSLHRVFLSSFFPIKIISSLNSMFAISVSSFRSLSYQQNNHLGSERKIVLTDEKKQVQRNENLWNFLSIINLCKRKKQLILVMKFNI